MKPQIIRSVLTLTAVSGIILLTMTASQSRALAEAISEPQLTAQCYRNRDFNYRSNYDINTVATIKGKIVRVDRFTPTRGRSSSGVHLLVKTEDKTIPVHLGPSWYLADRDFQFTPDTEIEIAGSKIVLAGKDTIIAREVRAKNKVLVLRDRNGIPVWSGWMRRSF